MGDLLGCRWHADEVEGGSPNQGVFARLIYRGQAKLLHLGQRKQVDLAGGPILVLNHGRICRCNRLKRPEPHCFVEINGGLNHLRFDSWVWGTHLDPSGKILDHRFWEFPLWRHLKPVVFQSIDQEAFPNVPWDHGGSGVAACLGGRFRIKPQASLYILRRSRVALITVFHQNRAYTRFKKFNLFCCRWGLGLISDGP